MQHPIVIRERKELSARQPEECIRLLEKEEWHGISCVNWQERFPYCPQAGFRAAHNGQELFIHFTVEEAVTAAIMTENNTQVCQDSCVEFFLSLDEKGYYNFEFSCIGVMMLGFRKERPQAVYAPQEVLANIGRFPSLGKSHFEEKALGEPWGLLRASRQPPCSGMDCPVGKVSRLVPIFISAVIN